MTQFSRKTILVTTDLLENAGHARITRFLLEHALEDAVVGNSMRDRASALARHLLRNPEMLNEEGRNLADAVVEDLVNERLQNFTVIGRFDYNRFAECNGPLVRALARDGFTVEGGELRRTLPQALALPATDDEVHALLTQFDFDTPRGHLDQAIAAHARGDWAAANGQLRTFVESLFDHIATAVAAGVGVAAPATGNASREWLAQVDPPFFSTELNEWAAQGTGFVQGFFRRLHPQGAHPGLSGEEDSTFRLHLVLLNSRMLLRRLAGRR